MAVAQPVGVSYLAHKIVYHRLGGTIHTKTTLKYQYQYAGTGIIGKRGWLNVNAEFRVMRALGMRLVGSGVRWWLGRF